ncbi:MAG TPA: 3-methyl-2-oxobutanoate hydroxymethyltransferase [Gemmatimonadales bacterium]|nr:3-methyl-2-oxobutanoate hydroxymethyltransferase [Gemmatimonadales bacterium]
MTPESRPRTVLDLATMKAHGRKIAMLTCYDATFARLVGPEVDVLLVGDSVHQVVAGHDTTLGATLDQLIYHGKAVRRGAPDSLLIVDLPFLTYQVSIEDAIRNAGRVLQETGANGVKLEGGTPMVPTVRALVERGIPVMAHLGLMPQAVQALGGYRVQGREPVQAAHMVEEARLMEQAGAFGVLLELVPAALATRVTDSLTIPTIGIGAGPGCDGQVLVLYDMLGLNETFSPKFLKRFGELGAAVRGAARAYAAEVREETYPGPEHSFD